MSVGINPRKLRKIILPAEKDLAPEKQTTWLFRPLTASARYQLYSKWGGDVRAALEGENSHLFVSEYLQLVLAGWENLRDLDGDQVPVPKDLGGNLDVKAALDCISIADQMDLFTLALTHDVLTETQRGKSSPPSTPPTA